jgi:hypothetical protein
MVLGVERSKERRGANLLLEGPGGGGDRARTAPPAKGAYLVITRWLIAGEHESH